MQPCIKVQYIALQPLLDPIYIHMLLDPIFMYIYNGIYIMSNISVSVRRSHIFQPGTYCFCLSVLAPSVACTSVGSCCLHQCAQCWILYTGHCAQCCTVFQQCAVCTVLQECAPEHCSGACQRCLQQCPHLQTADCQCWSLHWCNVLQDIIISIYYAYTYILSYTFLYIFIYIYIIKSIMVSVGVGLPIWP